MTEFIYVGKAVNVKGQTIYGFVSVEKHDEVANRDFIVGSDNAIDSVTSFFSIKKAPCNSIGAVYSFTEFDVDEGKLLSFKGSPKFVRPFNSPFTLHWQQRSRRVEDEKKQKSIEANAINDVQLNNAIKTLKDRYNRLPNMSRRAFKVWLLEQL